MCSQIYADPIANWTEDSNQGFSLHLSGNLSTAANGNGQLWNGSFLSPTGDWTINFGGGFVRRGLGLGDPTPDPYYTFVANSISGEALSDDTDLRLATSGYACRSQTLSWGSGSGWAMILGADSQGWQGSTYITFTSATDISDFDTWQWQADIYLSNPSLDTISASKSECLPVPDGSASTLSLLCIGLAGLLIQQLRPYLIKPTSN